MGGEYLVEVLRLYDDFHVEHLSLRDSTQCHPFINGCHPTSPSGPLGVGKDCVTVSSDGGRPYLLARLFFPGVTGEGGGRGGADAPGARAIMAGPGWFAPSGYSPPVFTRMQRLTHAGTCDDAFDARPGAQEHLLERYFVGGSNRWQFSHRHPLSTYSWGSVDLGSERFVPAPSYTRAIRDLCIVGRSHARELTARIPGSVWAGAPFAEYSLFDPSPNQAPLGLEFEQLDPRQVLYNNSHATTKLAPRVSLTGRFGLHNCSHILLHYGQWDAGFPCRVCDAQETPRHHGCLPRLQRGSECKEPPCRCAPRLGPFERGLHARLDELERQGLSERVVLMSASHNGLHCGHLTCPPLDFRTPPTIDAINLIHLRVAGARGYPYIDNEDIVKPKWDESPDFSHPAGPTLRAMANRIVNYFCEVRQSAACAGVREAQVLWPDASLPAETASKNAVNWSSSGVRGEGSF